jgi:hypothetical protein
MSGGGERYDDQYESAGGGFGDGGEVVTTDLLDEQLAMIEKMLSLTPSRS